MKTKFTAPSGVQVEGVIIYTSPNYRDHDSFVNMCYDEIVYAQNRIVKIHHTLVPMDDDDMDECRDPQVTIISEYASIPELDE